MSRNFRFQLSRLWSYTETTPSTIAQSARRERKTSSTTPCEMTSTSTPSLLKRTKENNGKSYDESWWVFQDSPTKKGEIFSRTKKKSSLTASERIRFHRNVLCSEFDDGVSFASNVNELTLHANHVTQLRLCQMESTEKWRQSNNATFENEERKKSENEKLFENVAHHWFQLEMRWIIIRKHEK